MAVNNTTEEHLGLLIKMLKMTTSDNDNQALVAMRKSNELLQRCGGDWDTLLRGKVKIIGNPFENMAPPPQPASVRRPAPAAPPRPKPRPQFSCTDCGNPISSPGMCSYCRAAQARPQPSRPYTMRNPQTGPQPMTNSQIKAARRSGTVKLNDLA